MFVFVIILVFSSYLYKKDNFILATFSAGRIIMTISHTTCLSTARRQIGLRAVPFKSVGGRRNGMFFEGGEGPNSELVYTIRVYMISGRSGRGVSNF